MMHGQRGGSQAAPPSTTSWELQERLSGRGPTGAPAQGPNVGRVEAPGRGCGPCTRAGAKPRRDDYCCIQCAIDAGVRCKAELMRILLGFPPEAKLRFEAGAGPLESKPAQSKPTTVAPPKPVPPPPSGPAPIGCGGQGQQPC